MKSSGYASLIEMGMLSSLGCWGSEIMSSGTLRRESDWNWGGGGGGKKAGLKLNAVLGNLGGAKLLVLKLQSDLASLNGFHLKISDPPSENNLFSS